MGVLFTTGGSVVYLRQPPKESPRWVVFGNTIFLTVPSDLEDVIRNQLRIGYFSLSTSKVAVVSGIGISGYFSEPSKLSNFSEESITSYISAPGRSSYISNSPTFLGVLTISLDYQYSGVISNDATLAGSFTIEDNRIVGTIVEDQQILGALSEGIARAGTIT